MTIEIVISYHTKVTEINFVREQVSKGLNISFLGKPYQHGHETNKINRLSHKLTRTIQYRRRRANQEEEKLDENEIEKQDVAAAIIVRVLPPTIPRPRAT